MVGEVEEVSKDNGVGSDKKGNQVSSCFCLNLFKCTHCVKLHVWPLIMTSNWLSRTERERVGRESVNRD